MLNRSRLACLFALLALLGQAAIAAPMPRLDEAAPTLCAVPATDTESWTPTAAQVAALEKSLPAYFAASKAHPGQLPSPAPIYSRQYSGIIRDGKRYIWGSFYPKNEPVLARMKPGSCWSMSDGGNAFWNVTFDTKTGIIKLAVNGVA